MPLEWGIIMKNIFDSAYPFTTECISGYFDKLDLAKKDVLTVGSSLDQAFNALLCGAGKVTVMDICSYTDDFLKLKKDIIINNPRKKAFKKILKIKSIPFSKDIFSYRDIVRINPYFENDENYELMQDLLKEKEIEVIEGDIFKMDEAIPKRKFDRIIFSNVSQYFGSYAKKAGFEGKEDKFINNNFNVWIKHLNHDGLIQLMYLYSILGQYDEALFLKEALNDYSLKPYSFDGYNFDGSYNNNDSAIVTYRKK